MYYWILIKELVSRNRQFYEREQQIETHIIVLC